MLYSSTKGMLITTFSFMGSIFATHPALEKRIRALDEGIKNKVVFCSPITLFAILAVIRQAVDNFTLEQASNEILSLLGGSKKQ